MIERRGERSAHTLLDAERGLRDLDHTRHLLGRRRCALDALRPPGCAGRVRHRPTHLPRRSRIGLVGREPAFPFGRAVRHPTLFGREAERDMQFRRRRDHDDVNAFRHAALNLVQQVGMHDQRLGAAITQDVAGLIRLVVPVDRAGVAAGLPRGQHRLEKRDLVAQHHGNDVAFADTQCRERIDPAQCALGYHRALALAA